MKKNKFHRLRHSALISATDSLARSSESEKVSDLRHKPSSSLRDSAELYLKRAKDKIRQFRSRSRELLPKLELTLESLVPILSSAHLGPSPPERSPPRTGSSARASPTNMRSEWNDMVTISEMARTLLMPKELRNEREISGTLSKLLQCHVYIGQRRFSLKQSDSEFCSPSWDDRWTIRPKDDEQIVRVQLLHSYCDALLGPCHADQIKIWRADGIHEDAAQPDLSLTVVWSSHYSSYGKA
jgi:hypothetical protein